MGEFARERALDYVQDMPGQAAGAWYCVRHGKRWARMAGSIPRPSQLMLSTIRRRRWAVDVDADNGCVFRSYANPSLRHDLLARVCTTLKSLTTTKTSGEFRQRT